MSDAALVSFLSKVSGGVKRTCFWPLETRNESAAARIYAGMEKKKFYKLVRENRIVMMTHNYDTKMDTKESLMYVNLMVLLVVFVDTGWISNPSVTKKQRSYPILSV